MRANWQYRGVWAGGVLLCLMVTLGAESGSALRRSCE